MLAAQIEEFATLAGLTDRQCAQIICDIAHVQALTTQPQTPNPEP